MKLKVFISWSGPRSKAVAEALRRWIPMVVQAVDPWVSTGDIEPGARWSLEIANRLADTKFGIICVTSENLTAPWLLFEAGALAKSLEETLVCPYLVDVAASELPGPTAQFQAIPSDRSGTLRLIRTLNTRLGASALSDHQLRATFDRWWPDLELELKRLPSPVFHPGVLSTSASFMGLEAVYATRALALEQFVRVIKGELAKASPEEPARLWVVGSSLKGLLASAGRSFYGPEFFHRIVGVACDLRIMMTHPKYADMRSDQEQRGKGEIEREIRDNVQVLRGAGVSQDQIRYYTGTPTVFAIATSDRMLLNPYPYERMSYGCFAFIVRNTEEENDIYDQYIESHFRRPWARALKLPDDDWSLHHRTTV